MMTRRWLLAMFLVVGSALNVAAQNQVTLTDSTVVSLYRGTSKVSDQPSWAACRAEAERLARLDTTRTSGTVTYSCKTETRKLVATYSVAPPPPPPDPVACEVSDWTLASATEWSACDGTAQTRTETWTRTVVTPAANGGTPCPALSETRTTTQACTITPPPPPPPGGVLFQDTFEYVADRADPGAAAMFVQQGWSHAKTQQNSSGAHGYLHTVATIPGYVGPFPGLNSTRVLALEALPRQFPPAPGTDIYQTDFFLQLGSGTGPANVIPGDVWFQFWIYPLQDATHPSQFNNRAKFFYACNTDYPCHSHLWMVMTNAFTNNPANWFPWGDPAQGQFAWLLRDAAGASEILNTTGDPYATSGVGPQALTEWMRPNRWTLVKMHMKTTATTGNSWEVWLKPLGGNWTKVSEWIGGVTPGFTWDIPAASVGGHRVLRMPTTVDLDYWLYMDDFVMATTEAALPVYR
jgi:hypothetical protein